MRCFSSRFIRSTALLQRKARELDRKIATALGAVEKLPPLPEAKKNPIAIKGKSQSLTKLVPRASAIPLRSGLSSS